MNLVGGNVLHIIDAGTCLENGGFVKTMHANTAWRMVPKIRIDVYAGAPDNIHTAARTSFNSMSFREKSAAIKITVRIAAEEGHVSVKIMERSP